MTIETAIMINTEITSQVARKIDQIKAEKVSQLLAAKNTVITVIL